ncbi:MAG: MCE family protein [Chryseolinea sp.]
MKNILTYILLLGLISCSDSEYYKVQFDNVDRLTEGDKVILKGLEVGEVRDFELDDEKKVLATIWVGRNIKLKKGSTFTIHSGILGTRHIEIELADNQELMNTEEIQTGYVQPPDTTGFKQLTAEQRDSLVTHVPIYRLADTVMTILRKSRDSTKVKQ